MSGNIVRVEILLRHIAQTQIQNVNIMEQVLTMQRQQFQQAVQSLDLLSPLKIMGRGYTYTTIKERVVKSVTEVQPDDSLVIHYQDGQVIGKVQKVEKEHKQDGKSNI